MTSDRLLNDGKRELCDKLKELEGASRKWRASLLVEINGIGRLDEHAVRTRQVEFEVLIEEAQSIYAETVRPAGLLRTDG